MAVSHGSPLYSLEATQQAERKTMNRSLVFATASHDIRSSLAAIDSFIQLYLEEDTLNSDMATNRPLSKVIA